MALKKTLLIFSGWLSRVTATIIFCHGVIFGVAVQAFSREKPPL
jgi:hypothetical protein